MVQQQHTCSQIPQFTKVIFLFRVRPVSQYANFLWPGLQINITGPSELLEAFCSSAYFSSAQINYFYCSCSLHYWHW